MLSVFRDNLNDIYIYIFWSPKFLHQAVMIDEISLSIWEFYFIGYRKQYVENLGTDDLCDFQEKTQGEKLHKLVVTVSSPLSSSTIPRYFFFFCALVPWSLIVCVTFWLICFENIRSTLTFELVCDILLSQMPLFLLSVLIEVQPANFQVLENSSESCIKM